MTSKDLNAELLAAGGWLCMPGQCLVCGGRGGYPVGERTALCPRCTGSGRDPDRESEWFREYVLPIQIKTAWCAEEIKD